MPVAFAYALGRRHRTSSLYKMQVKNALEAKGTRRALTLVAPSLDGSLDNPAGFRQNHNNVHVKRNRQRE